jgi:hypothetical protein
MSNKAKFDPLEAAKLSSDGFKETPAATAPVTSPAPKAPSTPAAAPTAKGVPSPSVASPPAAVAPPPKKVKYRVLEAKRVSCSGQLIKMLPGRVIDPAGYGGEAGIAKLRGQGLKLDRFEE